MIKGLLILIVERFPLGAYVPMIAVFLWSHAVVVESDSPLTLMSIVAMGLLTFSFFLRLRLFDEIKDYELDCKINPSRPLPRGVLTCHQVKKILATLLIFEVTLSFSFFKANALWWLLPMIYSMLMFKEFFIGKFIRPHLTTYGLVHTIVSPLLVFAMLKIWHHDASPDNQIQFIPLAMIAWPLFNLFEFGRKSLLKEEERPNIDTYSSLFGPWGAALMGISQILAALLLALYLSPSLISSSAWIFIYYASATSTLSALLYAVLKESPWQKIYRALSSAHILLFYLAIALKSFALT